MAPATTPAAAGGGAKWDVQVDEGTFTVSRQTGV